MVTDSNIYLFVNNIYFQRRYLVAMLKSSFRKFYGFVKHNPVVSSFIANHKSNTTGGTCGAGTAYLTGASEFSLGFLYCSIFSFLCFRRPLHVCPFVVFHFGHCIVFPSSICGSWLPYLVSLHVSPSLNYYILNKL